RWHRELFRLVWKRKPRAASHRPKVAEETITLTRLMAKANRLWGAERIRGELLKLGMHVCKRTIQKYMRNVRTKPPRGQKWSIFLRNHAAQICACDFLQITDLFFRPLFAFFIVERKLTESDACWSLKIPYWFLRSTTTARIHREWASSKVPDL